MAAAMTGAVTLLAAVAEAAARGACPGGRHCVAAAVAAAIRTGAMAFALGAQEVDPDQDEVALRMDLVKPVVQAEVAAGRLGRPPSVPGGVRAMRNCALHAALGQGAGALPATQQEAKRRQRGRKTTPAHQNNAHTAEPGKEMTTGVVAENDTENVETLESAPEEVSALTLEDLPRSPAERVEDVGALHECPALEPAPEEESALTLEDLPRSPAEQVEDVGALRERPVCDGPSTRRPLADLVADGMDADPGVGAEVSAMQTQLTATPAALEMLQTDTGVTEKVLILKFCEKVRLQNMNPWFLRLALYFWAYPNGECVSRTLV